MKQTCDEKEYLDCCLYFTSNTMNRLINKMTEEAFSPTKLAPSYAFLMMVVINRESVAIGKLADILKLAPSTVTRFVDKLVSLGYIRKEKEGKNITIVVTSKGKELFPEIMESWDRLYKTYCEVLGKEFAVKLTADMAKVNKILEK